MAGPWEQYQQQDSGPWKNYGGSATATPTDEQILSGPKPKNWDVPGSAYYEAYQRKQKSQAETEEKNAPGFFSMAGNPIIGAGQAALRTGVSIPSSMLSGTVEMFGQKKAADWIDRQVENATPLNAPGQRYVQGIGDTMHNLRLEGLAPEVGNVGRLAESTKLAAPEIAGRIVPPISQGVTTVADLAASKLRGSAESFMQSALKPTASAMKKGDASVAIDTMLKDNVPLSKKGVEQLRGRIDDLNTQISEAIQNSTGTVKIQDIEPYIKEKLESFRKQVNPDADLASIQKSWEEFKNHPLIAGNGEIPVQLAQELKKGTYKQLAKSYGQMSNAAAEAQKAIARGLKEGVAANAPEVVEFNKEESRLIRTLPIVERRVLMDANKNPMGLSLLAHNPASWAAFMADKSAAFKSMIARVLNATGEKIPGQSKPIAAPGTTVPVVVPPVITKPTSFRTPAEKGRAIRDAEKFNKPLNANLLDWYYSDQNPNNPLK